MSTENDNLDLMLMLDRHGWSFFWLMVEDRRIEFPITHVIGDPYADLLRALDGLMDRAEDISFVWYTEPGGYWIEIIRVPCLPDNVTVSIYRFEDHIYASREPEEAVIIFETSVLTLVALFYLQLKKTFLLLQNNQFAENRAQYFPFREFMRFEKNALAYLGLSGGKKGSPGSHKDGVTS